jgi:hypothetical protein
MARPHLHLGEGRWRVWRLGDDEFVCLGHHALPLSQNFELLLRLQQRPLGSGAPMTLAHVLTVLELRFGPSSPVFDAHHGSFSFPLLLTTERKRRISLLSRVHDHRGVLYFPMYRITTGDPSEAERANYHELSDAELTRSDVDQLVMLLHSYLLEQAALRETGLTACFLRSIPSDFTLYGYDGAAFFERRYSRWEEFALSREGLEKRLGIRRARSTSNRVERLIDEITRVETGTHQRALLMPQQRGK